MYASLKESINTSLALLPENALVGFVSFGKHVYLHDLLAKDRTVHAFSGTKEHSLEQIQQLLGFLANDVRVVHKGSSYLDSVLSVGKRFLQPVSMVEYALSNIVESLAPNTFAHSQYTARAERCTGAALNVASLVLRAILGTSISLTGGHLLCFVGGCCTVGPGKIVNVPLKEPLRSHHDIEKAVHATLPNAPNILLTTKADTNIYKDAKKFYSKIAKLVSGMGLTCNFFIGSYDQVGLFEMDEVCYHTGGTVVMADSFSTSIFKLSFLKFFKKNDEDFLDMGFNALLEVRVTLDLKVQGLIGAATAIPANKEQQPHVSLQAVGEGGATAWKLCNVNPQSTYGVYLEKLDSANQNLACIQFLFHYQHPSGEMKLRVTTIPIGIVVDSDAASLEAGFDQEAALVLVARDSICKLQQSISGSAKSAFSTQAIVKQVDRLLVDYCKRFAVYTAGYLDSFRLAAAYAMLPQFLYHLRRSQFINVFNNSPDETAYLRHVFMHEDTANSIIMIQPTLLSYDIEKFGAVNEDGVADTEPEPVLLDSLSLSHDKILLLDTFFQILIYHGSKVAEWRNAGYHEQEEFAHFKEFLEAPKQEAMEILMDRFPLPRFIDCDEGGSQARFLMAKLNPSTSYATNPQHQLTGGQLDVLTDDTSLQLFMDHVQRIVTAKN